MELDFDPRKNITKLDYFIMQLKKLKDLLVIKKIVRNWYDVLLFRVGLKRPGFVMQLRNGKNVKINKPENYFSFWESEECKQELRRQWEFDRLFNVNRKSRIIKFKFDNKILKFHYDTQKQLDGTRLLIKEQFIEGQYNWLDVKNKIVIDIGANIGDTVIYFALKGAKHVYAFEPYPYSYRIAKQNIILNSLQKNITLLNKGCGGKEQKIKISAGYKNSGSTELKNFEDGINIDIITLNTIVKKFRIVDDAILKIDCEGCEYMVLLEAQNSDLKRFKQIQIEYHFGYLNLKKKLEDAGFRVTHRTSNMNYLGLIYAERTN